MLSVKVYFILIKEQNLIDVTVHTSLSSVYQFWNACEKDNCVGILHVGFVRPKISDSLNLLKYRGKILVSESAKWALPDDFEFIESSSVKFRLNDKSVPIYLLTKGLNFNLDPSDIGAMEQGIDNCNDSKVNTIAEAALQVLKDAGSPLTQEEIFAHIIEKDLFNFKARKPVSVLSVELNRHCLKTTYTKSTLKPLFKKWVKEHFH